MVRIRLQRGGRKKHPIYRIVAADQRYSRDGRFLEKLGLYNPNTNPATIDLDFNKALQWVMDGAQPSHTARRILSYKGVLYKKHLQMGVLKGALTQEDADRKFEDWMMDKEQRIQGKIEDITKKQEAEKAARHEAESKVREAREEAARKKEEEEKAAAAAEQAEAEAGEAEAEATGEAETDAKAEEKPQEEAPAEDKEEKKEEKKGE